MLKQIIPVAIAVCISAQPACAEDWWWIGVNGQVPTRVMTYIQVDAPTAARAEVTRVTSMAIGETPLLNGQVVQLTLYDVKCSLMSMSQVARLGYDGNGAELGLPNLPPSEFAKVAPGSIGESIAKLACGRPAGFELKVPSPTAHSESIFRGVKSAKPDVEKSGAPKLSVGTGFFVGPDGGVLTSFHVVEGATSISCRTDDGKILPAKLKKVSMANDLALLEVGIRPRSYLGLADAKSIRPGNRVFTIGFGAVNYLGVSEPRFSEGSISALSGLGAEDAYMQITVPVQPGNSGGPLVNEKGLVVGVIAAQAAVDAFIKAEGTLPQSINWAVKAEYAKPLIGKLHKSAARDRTSAIANAKGSLCFILAEREGD